MKTAPKRPFFGHQIGHRTGYTARSGTKLICGDAPLLPPVVLSYLDAAFEPRCGRQDFRTACCCLLLLPLLLLAKMCCSSLDPKKWCKTSIG